jgi:predicted AlkP superfamily pyrophosphatase or phosphodiesterase
MNTKDTMKLRKAKKCFPFVSFAPFVPFVSFVSVVLLVLVVMLAPLRSAEQQPPAAGRHVVLISIDGFAAFHLDNTALDLPNLRALAAAGVSGSSETVFPSMTHPAHTTLITGATPRQHGVVNNRVVDRRTGSRFHITNLPRSDSIKVPTLFDAVSKAGGRTAALFWPETKDDPSITDNVAEVFDEQERAEPKAVSPALLAELRQGGVPIDSYYELYDDPFTQGAADVALTEAAIHLLKTKRPALVALHLLVADKVQHDFGPTHYLTSAALTTADHCIGLIRAAIADAGIADRTTIAVVADHGFTTVRDEVNLAPVLRESALERRIRWTADGWYVWGETLPDFQPARDGAALERVLARAAATPGVARVVRPGEFGALGYPEYQDNVFVPGQYLISGDVQTHLALDEKSQSTARRPRARVYHGHGYFPDHPSMRAMLVMSGAGIGKGRQLGQVKNVDIAPTLARLLGVSLPTASGRVLTEALQ